MKNPISKLKDKARKIKEHIKGKVKMPAKQLVPYLLVRLLLAWILISLFCIASGKAKFHEVIFFEQIKLKVQLSAVFVLWVILCKVSDSRFIDFLLVAASLVYCVLGVIGYTEFSFSVGCCAFVCLVIFFSHADRIKLKLHGFVPWIFGILLILAFNNFVGGICCLYYKNHWTSCYDFGLFSQMFHYMKETGQALITCERDGLLSHFAVHFSPIFYLLLPVYMLIPKPETLLVMQALVVTSGVIPLILICKRHKLSNAATCAFSVVYTLYPCFAGGCFTYIHENNFLAPLVLWLVYFCEKGKALPKLIFTVLLLCVKEDAAVYAAVIALYFLFTDKNYKCNLLMLIISVIWFIVVTNYLSKHGDGVMTYRYGNYILDGSGSLWAMIGSIIKNPVYVLQQCFTKEKLTFILQMLLPLMFMPFMTKKLTRYILVIPFLLINLMTNYQYQYDIGFQYGFGSGSLLIYLSVINYAELERPKLLICSLCCSVIVFFGLYYHRLDYREKYEKNAHEREVIDAALEVIPKDASVISSTFLLPNLSQRKEIYDLEYTKQTAEYYVLDLRYETDEFNIADYLNDNFVLPFYEQGVIAVFQRVEQE